MIIIIYIYTYYSQYNLLYLLLVYFQVALPKGTRWYFLGQLLDMLVDPLKLQMFIPQKMLGLFSRIRSIWLLKTIAISKLDVKCWRMMHKYNSHSSFFFTCGEAIKPMPREGQVAGWATQWTKYLRQVGSFFHLLANQCTSYHVPICMVS